MLKGKIIAILLIALLGFVSSLVILSNVPSEDLQTVTSNDVTVTTDQRSGLYVTFSKGEQTSVVKLWTVQEINIEGKVVNQFDISKIYLKSHEQTTHETPTKIVLKYVFSDIESPSNKPPTLKIIVFATTNGITVQGQLIDFEITGKGNTFLVNYERDNVGKSLSYDSYTFTLTFEFATAETS